MGKVLHELTYLTEKFCSLVASSVSFRSVGEKEDTSTAIGRVVFTSCPSEHKKRDIDVNVNLEYIHMNRMGQTI